MANTASNLDLDPTESGPQVSPLFTASPAGGEASDAAAGSADFEAASGAALLGSGPMVLLRSAIRLAAAAFWLFGALVGLAIAWCLQPLPRLHRSWRNRVFRTWARGMATIVGMRVAVHGRPPEAPFFLVANHLSYLDIIVLATVVDAVFVSKAEVRGWPVFGWACAGAGTIFVDRSDRKDVLRVHQEMRRWRERGYGLVMFPEGTSTVGAEVARFKPPLLEFPIREAMAVHAAAISYRTAVGQPPAHLHVCWWGDMPFFAHLIGLVKLPAFDATVHFADDPIFESDRKSLAARLHADVSARFSPVVAGRTHVV